MPTRNPADLWDDLVAEAGEDATELASQMGTPQAERELLVAGFDVFRERAQAVARVDALVEGRTPGDGDAAAEQAAWVVKAEPAPRSSRMARWPWLLAATLAVAGAGGVLYALGHRSKPIDKPVEVPPDGPPTTAPPRPDVPTAEPSGALPGTGAPTPLPPLESKPPGRRQPASP